MPDGRVLPRRLSGRVPPGVESATDGCWSKSFTWDGSSALNFDRNPWNPQNLGLKTTLDLPNDLVRAVRLRAVVEGRNLKDVVSDLLRRGLKQFAETSEEDAVRKGKIQLPLFPATEPAPARCLSMEALIAAEQEALICEDRERIRPPA